MFFESKTKPLSCPSVSVLFKSVPLISHEALEKSVDPPLPCLRLIPKLAWVPIAAPACRALLRRGLPNIMSGLITAWCLAVASAASAEHTSSHSIVSSKGCSSCSLAAIVSPDPNSGPFSREFDPAQLKNEGEEEEEDGDSWETTFASPFKPMIPAISPQSLGAIESLRRHEHVNPSATPSHLRC